MVILVFFSRLIFLLLKSDTDHGIKHFKPTKPTIALLHFSNSNLTNILQGLLQGVF